MVAQQMHEVTPSTVYIVGAGPGDPGLFTRAGAEALAGADVVIYDRLASPELLALARTDAELVYVGKASSQHTRTQDEINALLAAYALQGKSVCRLKGGDPFVFGRGGEEAAYLRERDMPFAIIPGVTSAIAVPAYAGIPVTDRRCASSFAVITGHEDAEKTDSTLDWAGIAHGADTLIFLMGLANLPTISAQLVAYGRPGTTPVAAIQQGSTLHQRVVTGTLADIAERVKNAKLQSPVITVVGEVVALREQLAWFDTRPLFGKRILVTRAREQASSLSTMLAAAGAIPVECPLIRITPLPPADDLPARLLRADWIIFTSANGLPSLLGQLQTLGNDIRALGTAKIAAIGPATAEVVQRYGLHIDCLPTQDIAEAIAESIPEPQGKHIVIARAETAREVLPELLAARGATVDILPVYRTTIEDCDLPDLATIDAITFTSSSTVRNFHARYAHATFQHGPRIACIGPITAQTAREMGFPVDIEAAEHTIPALVTALIDHFTASSQNFS